MNVERYMDLKIDASHMTTFLTFRVLVQCPPSGPQMAASLVRNLLIYPDQVNRVLEVSQITDETTGRFPAAASLRRVLVVISHKDDWNPTEEGW